MDRHAGKNPIIRRVRFCVVGHCCNLVSHAIHRGKGATSVMDRPSQLISSGQSQRIKFKKQDVQHENRLEILTENWGSQDAVTLYLNRCRVDTPVEILPEVWSHVRERRRRVGKVVDFGAGDGRFATNGSYHHYVGYEIDSARCATAQLPPQAALVNQCAFSVEIDDADVCIGNPPYVRNQSLPLGWRQRAAEILYKRTGVAISGLANAWQYFFLLALASTKADGLVALIVPYEWVSRPSAHGLREHVRKNGWNVHVYRLRDDTFKSVLTTSSITIIDKRGTRGQWEYFEEIDSGVYRRLRSPSGEGAGVVAYASRTDVAGHISRAKRGLSPGTQRVLTLTEGERIRSGLRIGDDVVPCVTTLRQLDPACTVLTSEVFKRRFRMVGAKCWLIRTDQPLSPDLKAYLNDIPESKYQTSTCLSRKKWWEFKMPDVPSILVATGFRGARPKAVVNEIRARAVGSVCGAYGLTKTQSVRVVKGVRSVDLSGRIVPHSNGLKKLEVNQLNTLLELLVKANCVKR
jgi:hypothetical protein